MPTVDQLFQAAVQHHEAGRLGEAEQLYRQILAQRPMHAGALHLLGVLAGQVGRNDIALNLIRQAIALRPTFSDAHYDLGNALTAMGQLDEAIADFRQAIALRPNFPDAHNNLGNALKDNGQLDQAVAAFRQAIALRPDHADAHCNLGNILNSKGQLDEAIAAYLQAIAVRPNYPDAHSNLSVALKNKGELDQAIAACRQAIALRPDHLEAHINLGNALNAKGQLDEAIAAFRQAITLRPDFPEAHSNLGNVLNRTGQLDEAIAEYRRAMALRPSYSEAHSNLVYALLFHPDHDAPAIAEETRGWSHLHAEPLRQSIHQHGSDRAADRRLRIGYVSPNFRDHVVGRNLLPLFRQHNRRQFEITCYAQVVCPDAITLEFQRHTDRWRNIMSLSDDQVAEQIRADQIDILVDLTMHMAENRALVFAHKPAPVQTTFAAYPGTTGLSTIDYRLSDPYLDPRGMNESVYSEQTLRLPHTFWCYDPRDARDIPVNPLPASLNNVITFGCLNNFNKVNGAVLRLWARVLQTVPDSRLLLLVPEGATRQHTLEVFRQEGVAPQRIEFAPFQHRRKYLELYHRIDVGLDTFPYNGHTTSLDSLWMGVPVVTLVGQTVVGRAGLCQLMNLGLPELIAETPDQYVQAAAALANDAPRLAELRSTLRSRMERSPLMDAARFARDIEAAYRQMWTQWCNGSEQ